MTTENRARPSPRPKASEMSRLAAMFDGIDSASSWSDEELAEILSEFLRSPLPATLDRWSLLAPEVRSAIDSHGLAVAADVFTSDAPPVAVLEGVKTLAKLQDSAPEPDLPPRVARVVYYAAILHARATTGALITSLPADELDRGVKWCLDRAWIPRELASVFEAALADSDANEGA